MEDLLSAMLGIGGRYIRASVNNSLFSMDDTLVRDADPSVLFLASRILPACGHYVRVTTYIESRSQYQYGLTVHALCASMRSLINEYTILIAQLEHQFRNGSLSLQKLFFYTQPALRTLAALDDIVYSVGYRIGGDLLNVIDRLRSECGGDRKVHSLYSYLLSKSSIPTFNMLTRWVHYGDVSDQYSEFMISVNRDQSRADLLADFNTKYWASRYTVRGEMVPIFLQRAAEKILTTGKYLNVLRGCGIVGENRLKETRKLWILKNDRKGSRSPVTTTSTSISVTSAGIVGSNGGNSSGNETKTGETNNSNSDIKWAEKRKLQYDNGERSNIDSIENAYHFSSKALLDLLLRDHQLLQRLKSLKHYFLVDQGDFFVHFMDAAEDELRRSTSDISTVRLEFLLESSVRQSISESDVYRNDLKCSLLPYTLIQHLELVQQLSGENNSRKKNGGNTTSDEDTNNVLSSSRLQSMDSIEDTRRKLLLVRRSQQLKGMEAFALDYEISWPLSIVISRKELTKYQLIFRHLFFCNHVKRQLSRTWLSHQTLKELDLRQALAPTYTLRHRMLHFIQNLLYYMMVEVLEPRHHELEQNVNTTSTVDEVLLHHSEFLDTCLKECLLSNHELIKLLTKIMTVCLLFSEQIEHFTESNRVDGININEERQQEQQKRNINVLSKSSKSKSKNHDIQQNKFHKNSLEMRRTRLNVCDFFYV
jgi:gamma-tubulin complex component 2